MRKITTILLSAFALLPQAASAHGIGEVYALPVPLEYYLLGAGLAVAVSFFILAVFFKNRQTELFDRAVTTNWLAPLMTFAKLAAVALLLFSIFAGFLGSQNALKNFTPIFFWVYFLIGMGILSLAFGNLWEKINPFQTISNFANDHQPTKNVSGAVGVILLLGLFWLELVSGVSFAPRVIAFLLTLYTLVNLIGSAIFANWYRAAELFSVFFGFIGCLSHWRISDDNRSVIIVNESKKLDGSPAPWWSLGVAAVMLAGTSFDSFKETVIWYRWLDQLHLSGNGFFAPTLGLILSPLPFLIVYMLAIWIMRQLVGRQYQVITLAKVFIWSLVPIAFGYTLAHNFSLVIVTASQMLAIVSDPLGLGWNVFGTASPGTTGLVLGAKFVWFIEIGFVILAHIFGGWYAHILAGNIFKDHKLALRSQYPMMVLMISFTILTLWLLSQPLVVIKN